MMQTDVKAAQVTGDGGSVYAARTRVKSVTISYSADATVVLKDGGSGGTTRFSFTAPSTDGSVHVLIPGEGILFYTNVHATLSGATAVVFYG
jgi:hypothetical protein